MFVLLPSSSGSSPGDGPPVLDSRWSAASEGASPAPTPSATNAPVQVPDAPVEYGTPTASADAPAQPTGDVIEHVTAPTARAAAHESARPASVTEPEPAAHGVSTPESTPATQPETSPTSADTSRTAPVSTTPAPSPGPVDPKSVTQPQPEPTPTTQPQPEPTRGPYTAADHAYQQNPGTAPQPPGSWVENPAGSWPLVSPADCPWPLWVSPDGYCLAPDGSGDEKD